MPEHIRYERPPVREMTCEFRFPGPGWDATLPGLIYVALKDVFPRREMTRRVSITHSETEGAQEAPTRFAVEQIVQFKQPDGLGFVQLAPNVISFHRLAPYPGWIEVEPLIARVFHAYQEEAKPEALTRIGLRYLNDLMFPTDSIDLEEYLNFYTKIGDSLPQSYTQMQTSVVFILQREMAGLRVQLHTIPSPKGTMKVSLRLDLDHSSADGVAIQTENALAWVNRAHTEVRDVFEACLKPNTRELFGGIEVVNP